MLKEYPFVKLGEGEEASASAAGVYRISFRARPRYDSKYDSVALLVANDGERKISSESFRISSSNFDRAVP